MTVEILQESEAEVNEAIAHYEDVEPLRFLRIFAAIQPPFLGSACRLFSF